ncbi:MAG: hypothetical protein ABII71_03420 [Candidatus Micrarchaeota archaeon]
MRIFLLSLLLALLLIGCVAKEGEDIGQGIPVTETGCSYGNPPCSEDFDCVDNECVLKQGCAYDTVSCGNDSLCTNNTCVLRDGCNYGNPSCGYGYSCSDNMCVAQIFADDGRLTEYARSLRPELFSLDLNLLAELHPESYGNNYLEPGNYTVRVGDGFGDGDLLVKFMEFIPQNDSVNGQIRFEVFRKERDGNYYHYPTIEDTITRYSYTDIFGIVIESPGYSWQIDPYENALIYHSSCTVFQDYCRDEGSGGHYSPGYLECAQRCQFDALPEETKAEKGIFSAIYPAGYGDLALFSAGLMKSCYRRNVDFLGFDPKKPRIGMEVFLADGRSDIIGSDESISAKSTAEYLDLVTDNLDYYMAQSSSSGCASYMRISHELTHIMANHLLGIENRGLIEGLAEFVEFHNNASMKQYVCLDDGWHYGFEDETKDYIPLSASFGTDPYPSESYYATGYCFWNDFVHEYGYPKFVLAMHALNQESRGIEGYYVLDVIGNVTGNPLPYSVFDKYSLTRESTYVPGCTNCELFLGDVNESGVWIAGE